jgi:hypothetical protein
MPTDYDNLTNDLKFAIDTAGGYPETGDVFMVCKSSLASYNWLQQRMPQDRLYTTLAAANAAMTASSNEKCYIAPGHTEAVSAEIPLAKAGLEFLGMGRGNLRPTFTHDTTAQNTISLDANNIRMSNVMFGVPGFDAVTADIDVVGAGCVIDNCESLGSTTAKNKVAFITLTATAHDTIIDSFKGYNDTVEMVGGIVLEGAAKRVRINNVAIQDSIGFTNGSINDAATALLLEVTNSIFSNAKADTVVAEFGNNTTGIMSNCFVNGRHTTIASNITPGTGMNFHEVYVVEEAAKNGLYIPAQDAE